jgi:hypothetical protein
MDSIHFYQTIKKFSSGTVLELALEIEKLYDSMANDKKNAFVIYLEFDFLANFQNEIISDEEKNQGLYRFMPEYDIRVAELNNSKQHYQFLTNWVKQKKDLGRTSESSQIDLSDTTAAEKIIYLHKTGILEFLGKIQPFNTSTNKLASLLSAITGENQLTIQSAINPIVNKDSGQKNNPLNTEKTVSKVENQLVNLGFKSKRNDLGKP